MFTTAPLFGKFHSPKSPLRKHSSEIDGKSVHELHALFKSTIPDHLLGQSEQGPNSRQRVFSVFVTFWTFLWQAFNPKSPCREAVRQVQSLFALMKWGYVDEDTGGYCTARKRFPLRLLLRLFHRSAQAAENSLPTGIDLLGGRPVKLVDGSGISLADTPENQARYPQPTNQKKGCGFPLLSLVGLFSLSSGALLAVAKGNQHVSERRLFRRLWRFFASGDVVVDDRGFCDYATIAGLLKRGVDNLTRLHQARRSDFRQGRRLGKNDRLISWHKPRTRSRTCPKNQWEALPDILQLRLVRFTINMPGFRTQRVLMVTTLLDPKLYPVSHIAALYRRRWNIELWFRHIKTTMKVETLRCLTPKMVHKELLMHLIAYNLIRTIMAQAAATCYQPLERISFKGTVDAIRHYSKVLVRTRSKRRQTDLINELLFVIAIDLVPDRPNRYEPRVLKRRLKSYPLMTRPRHALKRALVETSHNGQARELI